MLVWVARSVVDKGPWSIAHTHLSNGSTSSTKHYAHTAFYQKFEETLVSPNGFG